MIASVLPGPASADVSGTTSNDVGTVPAEPFGQLLSLLGGSPGGSSGGTIDAAKTLQALATKLDSMDKSTLDAATLAALSAEVDALKAELARQATETSRVMEAFGAPTEAEETAGREASLPEISADAAVTIAAKVLMTVPPEPVAGSAAPDTTGAPADQERPAAPMTPTVDDGTSPAANPTAPGPQIALHTSPTVEPAAQEPTVPDLLASTADPSGTAQGLPLNPTAGGHGDSRPTTTAPPLEGARTGIRLQGSTATTGPLRTPASQLQEAAAGANAAAESNGTAPDTTNPAPAGAATSTMPNAPATATAQAAAAGPSGSRTATTTASESSPTSPHASTVANNRDGHTTDATTYDPGPDGRASAGAPTVSTAPPTAPIRPGAAGAALPATPEVTVEAIASPVTAPEVSTAETVQTRPVDAATAPAPPLGQPTSSTTNVAMPLEGLPAPTGSRSQGTMTETVIRPMALSATTVEQLQDMLRGADARRRIVVRLDPPELGAVTLDLTALGDDVRLVARAESPEAVRALLRQHADVQQALAAHGMSLLDFDVHDGARQGGTSAEPNERQGRQQPTGDVMVDDSPVEIEQEGELFL